MTFFLRGSKTLCMATNLAQPDLFPIPPNLKRRVRVIPKPKQPLWKSFYAFNEANPHVYRRIVQLARKAKMRGLEHYSMDGIFHVMRWEIAIRTKSSDQFRLNDHHTSFYARMVDEREDDLKGFFTLRKQRAKK